MLGVIMLIVIMLGLVCYVPFAECYCSECSAGFIYECLKKCYYTEWHYAECFYAERHYAGYH